ncbi:hypothetical protein ACFSBG_15310 [Georgenia yuyongxinii]|uniref:hypothetical protein n=1 Tax=Georgenia yuyongxinii TaxID=2589797 RepID=UPI00143CC132|nr:hypothetical protein [Georgenia yuyongxinii]
MFGALSLIVLLAGAVLLRNVVELGRPVLDVLSFLLVVGVVTGGPVIGAPERRTPLGDPPRRRHHAER